MARRGRLVTEVAALAVRWKLITWRRFDIAAVVVINASSSVSGRDVTAGRDLTVRSLVSPFTHNFIHLWKRQHNYTQKNESEHLTNQQHETLKNAT